MPIITSLTHTHTHITNLMLISVIVGFFLFLFLVKLPSWGITYSLKLYYSNYLTLAKYHVK